MSLAGRTKITDPAMLYESVGLVVYRCTGGKAEIWPKDPVPDSPVHYARFFERLYNIYDLRFAYPDSSGRGYRKMWTAKAFTPPPAFDDVVGFPWSFRSNGEPL